MITPTFRDIKYGFTAAKECQHINTVVKTTSVDVALVPLTIVRNRFGTGKTMGVLLKTHINEEE